jgi:hypothetical protein
MISESINKPCDDADDALPPEVLSTISLPGFPAPSLTLEEGMHVVCLRNLYPGVTNGTRLMITGIQTHVLKCLVMTGPQAEEKILLPKLKLIHEPEPRFMVRFARYQFPIAPASQ